MRSSSGSNRRDADLTRARRAMRQRLQTPLLQYLLVTLNQLYEVKSKLRVYGDAGNATRNIQRIRDEIAQNCRLFYEDPIGQVFDKTRTDLDAAIIGVKTNHMIVVEVIKPIIRIGTELASRVVQKGIVVVRAAPASTKPTP